MQTSVRLQRRFLELAGHQVTIVSPTSAGPMQRTRGIIELPSMPLGPGRVLTVPAREEKRRSPAPAPWKCAAQQTLSISKRISGRRSSDTGLPSRLTCRWSTPCTTGSMSASLRPCHCRVSSSVDSGSRRRPTCTRAHRFTADAWTYLGKFTDRAHRVTAPSSQFARLLSEEGVFHTLMWCQTAWTTRSPASCSAGPAPNGTTGHGLSGPDGSAPKSVCFHSLRPWPKQTSTSRSTSLATVPNGQGRSQGRAMDKPTGPFRGKVPYAQMLGELRRADVLDPDIPGFRNPGNDRL